LRWSRPEARRAIAIDPASWHATGLESRFGRHEEMTMSNLPTPTDRALLQREGLRYVSDQRPGISRTRRGKGFSYRDANGRPIKEPEELERIRALAIPPAWTDVWISPVANGHLQATGRDARGRKQYRYHSAWRTMRDETKYQQTIRFAAALPAIRERVASDLARPGLTREKVLATVVRLLDTTLIRIGNDAYARDNQSYGLTTMRKKHVDVAGSEVRFQFTGKSGQVWNAEVSDRRVASVVRKCSELPGYELFKYEDDDGALVDVSSVDVNTYLKDISGESFTAKDFRTWAGTVLAAIALDACEPFTSEREAKANVVRAIEQVAGELGNTPAICRKCYVHPDILDTYLAGELVESIRDEIDDKVRKEFPELSTEEVMVLSLLRKRLGDHA
jgi:DNA topoisomerase-1